jgi:hypothetical protein
LVEQQSSTAAAGVLERYAPPGGVACHGAQEFRQALGATLIKVTPGAAADAGHFPETMRHRRVAALLEQEQGQALDATLARQLGEDRRLLLHRITDEDQRPRRGPGLLAENRAQQAGNLRAAGHAAHGAHAPGQLLRVSLPLVQVQFPEAAVPGELDRKRGEIGAGAEHVRLQAHGQVPGGLPAGGRVHREHQSRAAGVEAAQATGAAHEGLQLPRSAALSRGAGHGAGEPEASENGIRLARVLQAGPRGPPEQRGHKA